MIRSQLIHIWDIWIRLFHWTLAASVGFLLYSGLTGNLFFDWHKDVGEFVLLLIIFRLVWGLVGSSNASLSGLLKSPLEGFQHIKQLARRQVPQEREHNAAGGWAVLAMILIIGTQAVTGLFIADEDEFVEGALYANASADLADLMYRIHHINADIIKIILILHIGMILIYALYAKRNLVLPMITGKIHWTSQEQPPTIFMRQWWVGVPVLFACIAIVGRITGWY